ncbi:amino acid adenylation domain-containing protein [Clostridium tagluense]|uniref:non-ribosomal peptide synthetase n=1 Tax=Clostridium tagluense TaxID=360422 RepID=UPI001C6E966E|nr:non-ribosomal peptide synthetase [Clostridium tagluense]MBW9155186.1 amino acid adenylation domain-containing protein [Clostridium tagluense]WLC64623.1 amino acid adenylation domain-containing protein [Clostridium tagluense]
MKESYALAYWKESIRKAKESEVVKWDHENTSFEEGRYNLLIDKELGIKLNDMCKNNNLLVYTFLVSSLKINLSKHTFKKNMTIGIPSYNADDKKNFMLYKILPLTSYINYEDTYLEYMMSIKNEISETYKNQAYLSPDILLENGLSNDIMDLTPISICMKGLHQDKYINYILESGKNELSFLLELMDDKSIKVELVYNIHNISNVIVESLARNYMNVLKEILKNHNEKIKNIKIFSEEEYNKILYEFNNTNSDYPKDKTIQELFEEQVAKTPDKIAVIFEDKNLTYRELNEKSNIIARILRKKGVKADSIVAIMVERSQEMIIGIMGILKSGGAYLPIDSNYPKDRIEYMLKDSESQILLSTERLVNNIEFSGGVIDLFDKELFKGDSSNLDKISNSSNLAYVIYTSGTTGKPKGTMIEHKSLVNRLNWMQKKYPLSQEDTILQKTTYTFDVSVWEILWWSLVGAKVCMLPPNDEKDPLKIIKAINKYSITTIHFVPSMLDVFLYCLEDNNNDSKLPKLRQVFCSGEALNFKQVSKFYKAIGSNKLLINLYGPTEATIDVSYFECSNKNIKSVPIGKPIDNIKLYILNNNELIPIGVPGELYISGDGLARGYLNRAELTDEKFVNNPFDLERKMYKTGDLAMWLPDGNIEFLGRIDNQVKIRGFRIELGEIENRLLQHKEVKEVAVIVSENQEKEKSICAYITSERELNQLNLKSYLKETLPEYMIPTYFVKIDNMPLTNNGKLDKKTLPKPNLDDSLNKYEAPRNEVEKKLAKIWSEVLCVPVIGINDNFFNIGGHSLKATILTTLIHRRMDIEISVKDIFELNTIKGISEYIDKFKKGTYIEIAKAPEAEYYPTSASQKRMFVTNRLEGPSTTYNLPMFYIIEGKFDAEKLNCSIRKVISRHEILRTTIHMVDGEIVQSIHNDFDFKVKVYNSEGKNIDELVEAFIKPFDLEKMPLLNCELVQIENEKCLLLFDIHHIISDGVSTQILIDEILTFYDGDEYKELRLQYKDFAIWQNNFFKSDLINTQEKYWLDMFKGELPVLSLPTDYTRPLIQTFYGNKFKFYANEELTNKLNEFAANTGTTLFMILFSVYNVMLSKLSTQEDIIVGIPTAGRQQAEVQDMIGMFVNTMVLRSYPQGNKTFNEFLQEIKTTCLDSMNNQDYQFEMLLDNLKLEKDLSRNPIFDVFFAFQNYNIKNAKLNKLGALNNLKCTPCEFEINTSKFDFILFAFESDNRICFELEYNTSLFKMDTIERMAKYFINIAGDILSNSNKKIKDIDMLCQDEKHEILFDFNNTKINYNNNKAIHELFEEEVSKAPNNIAIRFENRVLTYKEVNEKANKLAKILRKKGIVKEDVVGIMMEKSPDMVISLLATLKVGAAYLPIDPSYPKDRVIYMLNDSKAKVLLTKSESIKEIPFTALINLDIKDMDIVLTKPREYIKNFDLIPMPNRELIDVSKYKGKIGMASVTDCIALQTTRGCPYQCVFCHKVWSKNHTFRSAENIYNEIEYYYKRGVTSFAILDDCFNLNIENGKRLFRMIIKNKLKLKIFFPNGLRGDILTTEYIDFMVEAGVVNINLSLETASPRLQKLIKKHLNLDKFKNVMDYVASQHPNVILELATMHGFPTETEEEAMMTLNFVKDIKWIHFPYIHILKVFPNTEMEELALAHGVDKEAIKRSVNLAYHEIPDTLPFPKSFTRSYQAEFFNDYFLSKERIKKVLPVQMKILSEDALLQKYNAYLPTEIDKISDLLELAGIDDFKIPEISLSYNETASCVQTNYSIFDQKKEYTMPLNKSAKKMLFLDISQHFSSESMLYKVAEQPIGQLYLLTYLKERFKDEIDGRIFKSGIDFDSYEELKALIDEYKPDFIGIRTLSFYKEFFHKTVSIIRQWGINAPIITGGPYGTSDYKYVLQDENVDLVILGEGEYTTGELIENMFKNNFEIPCKDVLKGIKGIAYRENNELNKENIRNVILLDDIEQLIVEENGDNLNTSTIGDNLAYVMYTSGSTGKPKGVMVEHSQVNNCINWMNNEFNITEKSQVVQRTNLTFDPSVWEIFLPLYNGASIKLLTTEESKDAEYLIELITENKDFTMMYCPASLVTGMTYLLKAKKNFNSKLKLPYLIIGAEPISSDVVKDFYSYFEGTIVNTYGPTECTINNTYYYLNKENLPNIIPIGRPIANNQIYILSKNLEVLPKNVLGEIYIGGDSLARGYINNQEKTEEVFIENPFGSGRLYKTGDIGRILPNKNIEIMGRVDNQVKIRGYRIELQEIETALLKVNNVKECAVLVKDNKKKNIVSCKKCGVTSNYPNITINEDGVCDICENISLYENPLKDYFKTPEDLEFLLRTNKNHEDKYDCLVLYAGGRASAYALYQLVDRGFKVLVATYDNEYFSKADMERIITFTKKLSVDHLVLKHENTSEILKESLKSSDTACKGCFFTSSALAGNYAMENGIKFVIGATLSRGQIIENKLIKLIKQGIVNTEEIERELLKIQKLSYDMNENIYSLININSIKDGRVYDNVKYIDFYRYFDIKNEKMINYLNTRDEYWKTRKQYAIYSTNCSIKQIGDYSHLEHKGYHYYASATSWEKRLNHITLDDVRKDLQCLVGQNAFDNFSKHIGYQNEKNKEIDSKFICAYISADEEIESSQIRSELLKIIPSYMVPSHFVTLDRMPLTKEGKIDKKALPEPKGQVNVATDYLEARNHIEEKIIEVWKQVLRIDMIGIKDNFFNLGGDSIKAIQISANLSKYDLKMEIKDLFKYPTIRELSEFVKPIKKFISQEVVEGNAPLTPIQRYFFGNNEKALNYWNQSVMLYKNESFDEEIIRKVFNEIISHHDGLRFVYEEKNCDIVAYNRGLDNNLYTLHVYDLKNEECVETKIEELSTSIQNSINLKDGPLVKLGLFKTLKGDHLLIAIHHLVVDGVSWRILLEDFIYIYECILKNEAIRLPKKTTSFLDWSNGLKEYASDKILLTEKEYWNSISSTPIKKLYKDKTISSEENIIKNCSVVKVSFSKEETDNLLRKVNFAYNTEINDILLSALGMTINQWIGEEKILISLEGHGREKINEDFDISRTIGWFTTRYPVMLDMKNSYDIGYIIKNTKENLRKVPNKGIGYGVLKYISDGLDNSINPEISFNYLGSFDEDIKSELFTMSNISHGKSVSPYCKNLFVIDINGMVVGQQLNVSFNFNNKEYYEYTILNIASKFKENLSNIIDYCISKEEQEVSPSDYENKHVTIDQLENLEESLKDIFEYGDLEDFN